MRVFKELIVVLGYGCHLHEEMKNYLKLVAGWIRNRGDVVVITTGGFTNLVSAPGVSEASMMAGYLFRVGVDVPIILEERARTTKENLLNVRENLYRGDLRPQSITIFGDSIRGFKVRVLAKAIFKVRPINFIGYDLTKSWESKVKQMLIGTPVEIFGYYLPFIEKAKLKKRLRVISKL